MVIVEFPQNGPELQRLDLFLCRKPQEAVETVGLPRIWGPMTSIYVIVITVKEAEKHGLFAKPLKLHEGNLMARLVNNAAWLSVGLMKTNDDLKILHREAWIH